MNDEMKSAISDELSRQAQAAGEQAAMGFFERIFTAYNNFIHQFPEQYQWLISLAIGLLVANFLWQLIKRNWLWIGLAVLLFPGILPILKNFFDSLTVLLVGKSLD